MPTTDGCPLGAFLPAFRLWGCSRRRYPKPQGRVALTAPLRTTVAPQYFGVSGQNTRLPTNLLVLICPLCYNDRRLFLEKQWHIREL